MIKVFTLNEKNKIELTKEELENLLNESYWEGCRSKSWTYTTPSWISTTPLVSTSSPYTVSNNGSSISLTNKE